MLADYHIHSTFSDDSRYPLENICDDAIRQNLDEICITDHVDYGVKPDHDPADPAWRPAGARAMNVDYARYFPALAAARERVASELTVRTGLEFGVQTHTIDAFNALFEAHATELDFIILSIHQVGNEEFWNGEFLQNRTQQEYNDAYYEELLRVVERFSHYSVLGHLDLIKRYDPAGIYPFERNRDVIAEILKRVIADGKGIEVNTSCFRYGLPDLSPSTEILELYRDLGGRIITIGSDTHAPEHLGAYLNRVRKRLAAMGFTELTAFEHMEPHNYPILG